MSQREPQNEDDLRARCRAGRRPLTRGGDTYEWARRLIDGAIARGSFHWDNKGWLQEGPDPHANPLPRSLRIHAAARFEGQSAVSAFCFDRWLPINVNTDDLVFDPAKVTCIKCLGRLHMNHSSGPWPGSVCS
jgi:hypothetical protein